MMISYQKLNILIVIFMCRQWTATVNTKKLTSRTHRRLREALVCSVTNLKIGDAAGGGGGDGGGGGNSGGGYGGGGDGG